jgi:hypothetical protein
MWHTHPESLPIPSATDVLAMISLASETGGTFAHSLMIIIGTSYHELALATYAFSQSELAKKIIQRTCVVSFPPSRLEVDQRLNGSVGAADKSCRCLCNQF